jgi:putative thioredoxin
MEIKAPDFQKDVIDASYKMPIVVDFWAEWCAPCRILGPVLEKLAQQAGDAWHLVKINTEHQPGIAKLYRVSSIPAVKMFFKGQIIAEFVGALPETAIKKWLADYFPSESKQAIQEALSALKVGDIKKAKKMLEFTLKIDPANKDAKVYLAGLLFEEEPEAAVKFVADVDESHPMFDKVDAMRTLARLNSTYNDYKKQAEQVKSEPWTFYLTGIDAYRNKDYSSAFQNWIEALSIDSHLDNDGVRKLCVALFRLLGNDHELTQKYHRRFTSALY